MLLTALVKMWAGCETNRTHFSRGAAENAFHRSVDSALLGLLLALDAVVCPWYCLQPFEGDRVLTGSTDAKIARGNAFQSKLNFAQQCPVLAIARKHIFFAGGATGVINNIARLGISECAYFFLAPFNFTRQLTLLISQTTFEQQKRIGGQWRL